MSKNCTGTETPNRLDKLLARKKKNMIMTHVVGGYPDKQTTLDLINIMIESGVDMIEIQIPFSDPMADGPTIMKANQKALDNGCRLDGCLEIVRQIRSRSEIPLLFMTYANIPYKTGFETFARLSAGAGIDALIVPDLPYDEMCDDFFPAVNRNNLISIPVISPSSSTERIKQLGSGKRGFIYTTLKVGITGAGKTISAESLDFIKKVKKTVQIPTAAGFGISTPDQVAQTHKVSPIAVIGSHVINVLNDSGINGVKVFLKEVISQS